MLLSRFIDVLNHLEIEPSTNKKIKIIEPYIKDPVFLSLLTMPKLNVGEKTIFKTLSKHTGHDMVEIQTEFIFSGKISSVVESMLNSRKLVSLCHFFKFKNHERTEEKDVNISQVYAVLIELGNTSGYNKQGVLLHQLFNLSNSSQIINIITRDKALGIQNRNIFKALPGDTKTIARAYAICNNWFILSSNLEKLSEIKPMLFRPVSAHLCQSQLLEEFEVTKPIIAETKYDGARIQVHSHFGRTEVYTRKLENRTLSMPDFIKSLTEWFQLNDIIGIFDLELLPHTTINGKFKRLDQEAVMTRMGIHDIHNKMKDVQLDARLLDILMLDNVILIDKSYSKRRKIMEGLKYTDDIKLVKSTIVKTTSEFKDLFFDTVKLHEGVVVKPADSKYIPGNRELWLKIKPVLPSFDLIIRKAFYGKGKNVGLYSSFEVCATLYNGDLRAIGNVGIGFTEEDMKKITQEINSQPIEKTPDYVEIINPSIIIEVACEKVNLIRGHVSMDFARKMTIRRDKNEITTLEEMKKLVRKT